MVQPIQFSVPVQQNNVVSRYAYQCLAAFSGKIISSLCSKTNGLLYYMFVRSLFRFFKSSANLAILAVGISAGWSSPTIPRLGVDPTLAPICNFQISTSTAAWLIQMPLVGEVLVSLPTAFCAQRFGPKRTLLLCGPPLGFGALLVGMADNVALLFGGRLLSGIGTGIVFTVLPIYLSEIAGQRIRGVLCGAQTVLYKLGILVTFSLAPYLPLRHMAAISAVPAFVFALIFVYMPESPYWLIENGHRTAAAQSLKLLRGASSTADVQSELTDMEATVKKAPGRGAVAADGTEQPKLSGFGRAVFAELFSQDNRRSLWILLGTASIVPLCGSDVIQEYSQIIITAIPDARNVIRLDAAQTCIVLAAIQLVAAILGVCALDLLGRKPLLIGSSAAVGSCTAVVMIYFIMVRIDGSAIGDGPISSTQETMAVLAVIALMMYQVAYNAGLETVMFTLIGELWPLNLKALLSASYVLVEGTIAATIGKLFQVVSERWGSELPFAVFSFCSFAFIVFVVRLVPETRNRSLGDIISELRPQQYGAKTVVNLAK